MTRPLQGFLKTNYGQFLDLDANHNTLAEHLKFIPQEVRPGDAFKVPILLGLNHSVTFDNTGGSFTYGSNIDPSIPPATVTGSTISMTGEISGDDIAAMGNGDKASYMPAIDGAILAASKGADLYREIALHYGAGPGAAAVGNIGVVSTIVSGTNLGAGGPIVCDLTRASWAAGLWYDMVGAQVDIYESDATTLVESGVTVSAVSDGTYSRITLTKTGVTTDVDATDIIIPRTAKGMSCVGVQGILENTGTLFEISASSNPRWRALTHAVGGALSKAKVLGLAGRLAARGSTRGGKLFVNGNAFADLAEEITDLQRYNANTDSVKRTGAANIEFITPAGVIDVVVDRLQKQALGFYIANGQGMRVGTHDLSFRDRGAGKSGDSWNLLRMTTKNGSQLLCTSNQAPFLQVPGHCAILTGIQSTGDTLPSA